MVEEMALVLAVVLMETLEGGIEKTSRGDSGGVSPLRSSPAAAFCLSVSSLVFLRRLLAKLFGGLFMQSVLGQDEASGRRIDANGATRAKIGGPPRPSTVAAWAPPFRPSGLHFFPSFFPMLFFFQKMIPVNFQLIWTSFGSLKQIGRAHV